MSDSRYPSEPSTRAWTETHGAFGAAGSAVDLRVPGLTVLYHPDPERIGERAVLDELGSSRGAILSRRGPDFAAPGGELRRSLGDSRLSRKPIVLRLYDGHLRIERGESPTRLELDGRAVHEQASVPTDALDEGVVLLLGGCIVLLLHLLDPVADLRTPRFDLVGESPAVARLRQDILQVADLKVPVLLRGESGTGKELVARAIHQASPRRAGPWVALNMAAVPSSLASAELFGAERGAYTGAQQRRRGHFVRADGGTLFLDEIGETPVEVQALLLRALESGEIQALGGDAIETPDVRVISATDADLESAIEGGRFRGPLLHRLSGYVIRLPPLRSRREDIGRLLHFFLRRECESLGLLHRLAPRDKPWLPASLVARMAAWHWPGNVRQLANVLRQLVIANRDADPASRFDEVEALLGPPSVEPPPEVRVSAPITATTVEPQPRAPQVPDTPPTGPESGPRRASDISEEEIVAALRAHRFRPAAAADALGIPRPSMYDRMKRIPGLRKASELSAEEISKVREWVGPSVEAMAAELEVSELALRRRLSELGL